MGPAWSQTMVLVITEFGRTVRMNGTKGTDHGTATAAFILGGNVAGGKVLATWPGAWQRPGLREPRPWRRPWMSVRSPRGALAAHLGLGDAALARVFPGSNNAAPLNGLVRTA